MDGLSFDDCLRVVDDRDAYEAWRADFARSGPYVVDSRLDLPFVDDLVARCEGFGFPDRATQILADQRETWDHPAVQRLAAHHQWLVSERYRPETYIHLGYPPPPTQCPLFYAYAAVALAGRVVTDQEAAGIDPAVTAATMWDIGQQVMLHERVYGEIDMRKGWWLCHHLAGHLFRIGRLQYQRSVAGQHHGRDVSGTRFLDVHIPEDGPLDPTAVDRSIADATRFFTRHFPADGVGWAGCTSWLLDPVLADILPADSNIVAFQQRFSTTHVDDDWPSSVFEFVFDRPDLDPIDPAPDVEALPIDSTLRRAIVDHYRAGGRIRPVTGIFVLEPT